MTLSNVVALAVSTVHVTVCVSFVPSFNCNSIVPACFSEYFATNVLFSVYFHVVPVAKSVPSTVQPAKLYPFLAQLVFDFVLYGASYVAVSDVGAVPVAPVPQEYVTVYLFAVHSDDTVALFLLPVTVPVPCPYPVLHVIAHVTVLLDTLGVPVPFAILHVAAVHWATTVLLPVLPRGISVTLVPFNVQPLKM